MMPTESLTSSKVLCLTQTLNPKTFKTFVGEFFDIPVEIVYSESLLAMGIIRSFGSQYEFYPVGCEIWTDGEQWVCVER